FRTNSVQINDQKPFEQHDRLDARTPIILTIQGAAFIRDNRNVDGFIDFSKQVIMGNKVFYDVCLGLNFPGWVRHEHIKSFLRNCFIPNSTKKAVDPSLSTASDAEPLVPRLGGCLHRVRGRVGIFLRAAPLRQRRTYRKTTGDKMTPEAISPRETVPFHTTAPTRGPPKISPREATCPWVDRMVARRRESRICSLSHAL